MIDLLKKFFNNKKDLFLIICLVLITLTVFFACTIILKNNGVYKSDYIQEDRFYSFDDIYYVRYVYNPDKKIMESLIWSGVKHPLLVFSANIFANIESIIIGQKPFVSHYLNILFMQLIVSIIGIIFLYKILSEIIGILKHKSFLLTLIFIFSNTIIITTIIAESFIISSTLLILAYYLLSKKKYILGGIIGTLIFGITVTNVFIWALMVLMLIGFKNIKGLLIISIAFFLTLFLLILIIYLYDSNYLHIIMANFFSIAKLNMGIFTTEYSLWGIIRYGFFFLFCASLFYINTINTTVFDSLKGMSISFVPSANTLILIVSIITFVTITIFLIKPAFKEKDKNIFLCFLIIIFNIFIHCGLKFGINEAFIYTSHILFTYIILLGLAFKHLKKYNKELLVLTFLIFITQLIFNFKAISDMILVVKRMI